MTTDPQQQPPKRNALKAASDAVVDPALTVTNPFAAAALAVGIIAVLFSALGVLPTIGIVVSILGLVRSRRLARQGSEKTGRLQSIAGLVLSLVGLVRLLPFVTALLPAFLR